MFYLLTLFRINSSVKLSLKELCFDVPIIKRILEIGIPGAIQVALVNFSNLFKEKSGYNVRPGYPKALFSSAGCTGVYDSSAASTIGMVLAAKGDRLPDCVQAPEPVVEAPAIVETVSETPAEEVFSDSLFRDGEIETVIPEKKKEKAPPRIKVGRQKTDKNGNVLTIFWTKIKSALEDENEEV